MTIFVNFIAIKLTDITAQPLSFLISLWLTVSLCTIQVFSLPLSLSKSEIFSHSSLTFSLSAAPSNSDTGQPYKDWVFINYTFKRFEGLTQRGPPVKMAKEVVAPPSKWRQMAFSDSDGNFSGKICKDWIFPPKVGKYSGGVKSEILNATEEKDLGWNEDLTKNDFHRRWRRRDRIWKSYILKPPIPLWIAQLWIDNWA